MANNYDDDDDRDRFSASRDIERRIDRRRDDDDDRDFAEDDYPVRRRRRRYLKEHRASTILALGILGFWMPVLGIIAWVMGSADLKAMAEGDMDPEGEGMTRVGYVLGIVTSLLMIVGIVLMISWMVFIFAMIAAHK